MRTEDHRTIGSKFPPRDGASSFSEGLRRQSLEDLGGGSPKGGRDAIVLGGQRGQSAIFREVSVSDARSRRSRGEKNILPNAGGI